MFFLSAPHAGFRVPGAGCMKEPHMTARILTGALLILFAFSLTATAQSKKSLAGGREFDLQVKADGAEGMGFQLHLPRGWKKKSKRKFPVLMVLHGNGGAPERTLQRFLRLSTKKTPLIIVSPGYQKERQSGAPTWSEDVSCGAFAWIFKQAVTHWHGDPDRLFVQGFSLGGSFASYYLQHVARTEKQPGLRGAILNSGVAVTGRTKWPSSFPVLFIVGEQETNMRGKNYVEALGRTANAAFRAGTDARFHLMPGMGHSVNDDCIELIERLIFEECKSGVTLEKALATFKKRLKKNPRRMTEFQRITRQAEALEKSSRADRIRKTMEQLSASPEMVREREAWQLLGQARKADRKGAPERKTAYESLAKSHPKTEAGRIAAERLTWID